MIERVEREAMRTVTVVVFCVMIERVEREAMRTVIVVVFECCD